MSIQTYHSREKLKDALHNITERGQIICAHTAIIVFYSPVSGAIEERHIWSDTLTECIVWLSDCKNRYAELDFSYVTYLDGGLDATRGTLTFTEN